MSTNYYTGYVKQLHQICQAIAPDMSNQHKRVLTVLNGCNRLNSIDLSTYLLLKGYFSQILTKIILGFIHD